MSHLRLKFALFQTIAENTERGTSPNLSMTTPPHICPISEIPLAAQTVTSILNHNNPIISFLYNNHTPPPLIPYGKPEQLSIYLYRTLTTGLVLTVDDEDQKCVGVAVWQGPSSQTSILGKLCDWCVHTGFDLWNTLNWIYYGGSGMNKLVFVPCVHN